MKKQYVRGYGDNSSQKEKTALAVLAGVCIAAGLITLFTVSLIKGNKPKEQAVTKSEDRQVVEEVFENTNKTYEPEINSDNEDITKESDENSLVTETAAENIISFQPPCIGGIIKEYSPNTPVYSETLDDWRVHNGIDIYAPLGSEVCSVADGTVSNTTEDFRYGFTITIDHGNGIKSTYSNLSGTDMVKTGRIVQKGDVISTVGDTSLFETVADTHLHFEITKDGKYDDPLKYFNPEV